MTTPIAQADDQAAVYEQFREDVDNFDAVQRFRGQRKDAPPIPMEAEESANTQTKIVTPTPDATISLKKGPGFVEKIAELPKQAASGAAEAFNQMLKVADDIGDSLINLGLPSSFLQVFDTKTGKFDIEFLNTEETSAARAAKQIELFQFPTADQPKSAVGTLTRETIKFLTGFLPATRAVKAIRGTGALETTLTEAGIGSALAAGVTQDPHEDRLSAFLNTVPGISKIVPEYLADNDPAHESDWEGRLKNMIEDAGIGVFAEGLFKTFRFYKAQRRAKKAAKAETDPMTRAEIKESIRESAIQNAEEINPQQLSGLGNVESPELMLTAEVANKRIIKANARIEAKIKKGIDPLEAPIPLLKKDEIFINFFRIDEPSDVQELLWGTVQADKRAINIKRGGQAVSNKQTIKASDQEFQDIRDLIGRDPGPMTAAQSVRARKILASSARQLTTLAKRASSGSATTADLYAFRRGMSVHYAIQSEVIAARTETARALQSWRIDVDGTEKQVGQQVTELINNGGGAGTTKDMAKAIADVADNPTGLNKVVGEFSSTTVRKALYQIWIDGILSGPPTQLVNFIGNSITTAYMIPETLANAAISKMFFDGEIQFVEATARSYGLVKGIRDSFSFIAQSRKGGAEGLGKQFDQFQKFEGVGQNNISAEAFGLSNGGVFGTGLDYAGKFFNLSGTMLNTGDKWFKYVGYRMELEGLAMRQAIGEGITDQDALAARVIDLVQNPPKQINADSIDMGHYLTYTTPFGQLGQKGMGFLREANRLVPGVRMVIPFIRTPTNIMKFTFARTPLALLSRSVRADIAAGGARAAQAWGRITMGSMIMMTFTDMTLEGRITGNGPEDPRLRKNMMLSGWRPYSVRIGGKYIPYNRLDPIGNLVAYAASLGEIIQNADEGEAEFAAASGVLAFSQNLASKSYLSGIFDFMAAINPTNPVSTPENWMKRFATSLIPKSSFLRSMAKAIDPRLKITDTALGDPDLLALPFISDGTNLFLTDTLNRVKANSDIFGWGKDLPLRPDLWGEPITRASGYGMAFDLLSPIYVSQGKYDETEQYIIDNKIPIDHAKRTIQGVKLTAQEQFDYAVLTGKPLKKNLDLLIKNPAFKKLPGTLGSEQVLSMVNTFRKIARATMIENNASLRNRILFKQAKANAKRVGLPQPDPTPGPAALPVLEGERDTSSIESILGGR